MKKRYDVPEFMKVDLFEDVLAVSDNDNLGDDVIGEEASNPDDPDGDLVID